MAAAGRPPVSARRGRRILALAVGTALLAGLCLGVGLWLGEVPRWTLHGAVMRLHDPLPALQPDAQPLTGSGTLAFFGDSNTAGTRLGGPGKAYPAILARTLGRTQRVCVVAHGGATVRSIARRPWNCGSADLSIIMLGTNDAATRGWLAARTPVPLTDYRATLATMVRRLAGQGAGVLILAPPPVGTAAMERRLQPYRVAARQVAVEMRAAFLDPVAAFGPDDTLQFDALHLSEEAQQKLGLWLAAQISGG